MPDCQHSINGTPFEFKIQPEQLYEDELALVAIIVRSLRGVQILPITANTVMFIGDSGFIDFPDINFDSVPDLAVTTSFGTPNLYMDYWVYEGKRAGYRYIGNMSELETDPAARTLSTRVKNNAATYESKTWIWEKNGLVERPPEKQR